jgi:uncharacterized protein YcsI (UPF0317 family)
VEPAVAVITGFYIPHADPPCAETDGPLGAIFLARALIPLGYKIVLATDAFCYHSLEVGLAACGLRKQVPIVALPSAQEALTLSPDAYWELFRERAGRLTHLVALERVGPSHTEESIRAQCGSTSDLLTRYLREVPAESFDRYHTMRGRDITASMSPAHLLIEFAARQTPPLTTIGIGDGGNEIGMGKIPWDIIQRNIPGGARVACRVATDHLIVCGVSNWGAYALAAGVRSLKGRPLEADFFDRNREEELLSLMVAKGPLVDGVTGEATTTVDGLSFERYVEPLCHMGPLNDSRPATEPTPIRSTERETPNASEKCGSSALRSPSPALKQGPYLDLETMARLQQVPGSEVRRRAARGELTGPTAGMALGYVQANLVIVPRELAFDFLLFCQRNPKPCPLLDVTEVGSAEPRLVAPGADLRTDLPGYRVYQNGALVDEPCDLHAWWRDDLVGFLIGCSFTFENALLQAGLPVRHLEAGCNVPMFRTNRPCRPAGIFEGPMVVSMRPMTMTQAIRAVQICSRFPRAHGAPIHIGAPEAIGVADLGRPDFGDPVEIQPGEVPVFWACGVTPQAVVMQARPPFCITHKPGHMFVTDLRDTDMEEA